MRTIEVEVLSEASNQAVIKLPGGAFPGSVVQGDSLAILRLSWIASGDKAEGATCEVWVVQPPFARSMRRPDVSR
jgi:hypothetical protein